MTLWKNTDGTNIEKRVYRSLGISRTLPCSAIRMPKSHFWKFITKSTKTKRKIRSRQQPFTRKRSSVVVAQHRARNVIKGLRKSLDEFYTSPEGKDSKFEIYFIAESGDYKLGIRPKKINTPLLCPGESVSYNEHQHFIMKHKPLAINRLRVLFLLLAPLIF